MYELYEKLLSSNKSIVEIYNMLNESDFFVFMAIKYNALRGDNHDTYYNHDKVIKKIENECNQTKDEELGKLINHLKERNEQLKLEWKIILEKEEFKKQKPTPEEVIREYEREIESKKWKDIKEEIDYNYYDTYKEIINEVNQHDKYSDKERILMLVKNSSQKVSVIFLKQIKKYMPNEYYHFKSLVDKISPY